MAVQCANCGEELLGPVNRCWRCGARFQLPSADDELPPVRRGPIELSTISGEPQVLDAEIVDDPNATVTNPESAAESAAPPHDPEPVVETVRRGSPFAAGSTPIRSDASSPMIAQRGPRRTSYPEHTASVGGAVGAVVLGILSALALAVNSFGALFTAVLGIGLGLWGLYSKNRGAAIFGLALCCLVLAVAGFFVAVALFKMNYGYSPFEKPPPSPDEFFDEFSLQSNEGARLIPLGKIEQRQVFVGTECVGARDQLESRHRVLFRRRGAPDLVFARSKNAVRSHLASFCFARPAFIRPEPIPQ